MISVPNRSNARSFSSKTQYESYFQFQNVVTRSFPEMFSILVWYRHSASYQQMSIVCTSWHSEHLNASEDFTFLPIWRFGGICGPFKYCLKKDRWYLPPVRYPFANFVYFQKLHIIQQQNMEIVTCGFVCDKIWRTSDVINYIFYKDLSRCVEFPHSNRGI